MNTQNRIISIPDAHITFRNFRGEARPPYNAAGNRNFSVVLTPEQAAEFSEYGFNIRTRPPKHEDEDPQYLLSVTVSYRIRDPKIMVIAGDNRYMLNRDTVGELDYADIEHIDMTITPSRWSTPDGRSGIKAYLNSMYVTLMLDEFEEKYGGIPRSEN